MITRRKFLAGVLTGTAVETVIGQSLALPVGSKRPQESAGPGQVSNLRHVRIYRDPNNFCAEVSVEKLRDGELVAVFGRNRGLNHNDSGSILLVRSHDHGRTWHQEGAVTVFEEGDDFGYTNAALTRLSSGRLMASTFGYEFLREDGSLDGGSSLHGPYVAWSNDGGRTWTAPRKVRVAPMRSGAAGRDGIVELSDGTLLLPLCGLPSRHPMPEIGGGETWVAFLAGSTDGGREWHYWGTMAYDPLHITTYWEPGLVRLRDGRLLGMIRALQWPAPDSRLSENPETPSSSGGYLFMTLSEDGGASWSNPRQTRLYGYPADLIQLEDGRVLCTYARRREPMGIYIAISDDGISWDTTKEHVIREYRPPQNPRIRGQGFPRHIGYPTSLQLNTGEILSAYHLFDDDGLQYIEAAIYQV